MSPKKIAVVGLGILLCVAGVWWALSSKTLTPAQQHAVAAFTRPVMPAPALKGFQVFIAGVDAIHETPVVESTRHVDMTVILPKNDAPGDLLDLLFIVPRLDQSPEGFAWTDAQCDQMHGLNDPQPTPEGDGRSFAVQGAFNLKPGEYVVRYYRMISHVDPEKGPPWNEYLGEGRIQVTPTKSNAPSYVPLADKTKLIPLYSSDNEAKHE